VNVEDSANGQLIRFAIDYGRCLFCALCIDPCPTQCLHMGQSRDMRGENGSNPVVEFIATARKSPAAAPLASAENHAEPNRTPVLATGR